MSITITLVMGLINNFVYITHNKSYMLVITKGIYFVNLSGRLLGFGFYARKNRLKAGLL